MTNPQDICDALVEAGVLEPGTRDGQYMLVGAEDHESYSAHTMTGDWLVAGAVLELPEHHWIAERIDIFDADGPLIDHHWLREPRAILEAWYQARKEND